MNENINLCEILKDCPKKTKFYSYNYGNVEFWGIIKDSNYPILIRTKTKWGYLSFISLTKEGFTSADYLNPSCILIPSKDYPDWSKWKCPKPKFDPKTLKAFDKVLCTESADWCCDLFSHIDKKSEYYKFVVCGGRPFKYCIPYNEETKHLVGTSDEAPEQYRYWED